MVIPCTGMLARHRFLAGEGAIALLLAITSMRCAHRQIIINTSPSVAPGLYVESSAAPAVGTIVDFAIPPAARPYVQARSGCSGAGWFILKPIIAGPGDRVDTRGDGLLLNGRSIAPMPPAKDTAGRPLPIWRACRMLGRDEFFVFSNRIPNSFDSRCYGPIQRAQIFCVRLAIITW